MARAQAWRWRSPWPWWLAWPGGLWVAAPGQYIVQMPYSVIGFMWGIGGIVLVLQLPVLMGLISVARCLGS